MSKRGKEIYINKIEIIGRLTADPQLKVINGDVQVCTFTVAVNRRFNREETDFFPVTVWRETAINCNKFLAKGNLVGICGSLQIRKYDDKDGIKRIAVDLQADEVDFLTPKSENDSTDKSTENKTPSVSELKEVEDDDMPF